MWGNSDQRKLLKVQDFGVKGRGVIAMEDIRQGELIERSPVLIIPHEDRPKTDATICFTYVFMWEPGACEEDLYKHKGRAAIVLGYTSLLNHSYTPNAEFKHHIDEMFLDIHAVRDIKAGEEITIDYQMTLWFDPD
ncbi:MAG: SET domain-containing protein-lysine N-methyltransferase [Rhodospirillales bacterium]|nr:SET domain-containing protein-lysine N-methyltransferase [Rhodospirillales bacterium]